MAPPALPPRLAFALERLDLQPDDRVLEIGCGRGVLIAPMCGLLTEGSVTALDRSPVMIEAARARNADAIAAGRLTLLQASLASADLGEARFDKIVAVNVNLFWLDATRELPVVRKALAPGGALHLVYEPPAATKVKAIADSLPPALTAHGLTVEAVHAETRDGAPLLSVSARPAASP